MTREPPLKGSNGENPATIYVGELGHGIEGSTWTFRSLQRVITSEGEVRYNGRTFKLRPFSELQIILKGKFEGKYQIEFDNHQINSQEDIHKIKPVLWINTEKVGYSY